MDIHITNLKHAHNESILCSQILEYFQIDFYINQTTNYSIYSCCMVHQNVFLYICSTCNNNILMLMFTLCASICYSQPLTGRLMYSKQNLKCSMCNQSVSQQQNTSHTVQKSQGEFYKNNSCLRSKT